MPRMSSNFSERSTFLRLESPLRNLLFQEIFFSNFRASHKSLHLQRTTQTGIVSVAFRLSVAIFFWKKCSVEYQFLIRGHSAYIPLWRLPVLLWERSRCQQTRGRIGRRVWFEVASKIGKKLICIIETRQQSRSDRRMSECRSRGSRNGRFEQYPESSCAVRVPRPRCSLNLSMTST